MPTPVDIAPARGKLGVMLVGLGAVSTTTIAGVLAIRKGLAKPIGSLTQMGTVRLGKRTEGRSPRISEVVPLSSLDDLVFGAWDIFEDDCYAAARTAGVIDRTLLDRIQPDLEQIKPWPAVFDRRYVKRLDGPNVKRGHNKKELAEQVIDDLHAFKRNNNLDRLVMVWCGSTEVFMTESPAHQTIEAFECALETNDPAIPSSMVYAYAAIREGIPYANAAPNLSADIPALVELAARTGSPLAGKDLKTGQTLIKTIVAPGLKARLLGVEGWYSTNILGNRDGEVLDDPESFKTKEESKKSVLDYILQPQLYPDLYAGQASVSLVPFLVAESRPRGIPRVLATRFLETNLRTYVRAADGEAGIYFFSLDASSLLAVSAARLLYGLPHFPAAMSERTEEPRTEYSSRRRGARDAQLDMDEVLGAAAERARRHPRSFPDRAVQPVPPAW